MKLIRLIPWIGHRIERHPKRWAIGAGFIVLFLIATWLFDFIDINLFGLRIAL